MDGDADGDWDTRTWAMTVCVWLSHKTLQGRVGGGFKGSTTRFSCFGI